MTRSQEKSAAAPGQSASNYVRVMKSGRCANGAARDGGSRVHAVPLTEGETRLNDGSARKALCGTQPGRLAYWCDADQVMHAAAVSCPKCLHKLGRT